jgi:hypothetical protein
MKLGVIGNRDITNECVTVDAFTSYLLEHGFTKVTLLLGGADGAQDIVAKWAKEYDIDKVLFQPFHMIDNVPFETRFFYLRNKMLINNVGSKDRLLFIRSGTKDGEVTNSMEYARQVLREDQIDEIWV